MKANEFVKKFGWDAAIDLWCGAFDLYNNGLQILNGLVCSFPDNQFLFDLVDLKRLVESHELVGNFGGIKRAKRILKKSYKSFNTMVSVIWNDKSYQCTIEKLEQAILDVESCQ